MNPQSDHKQTYIAGGVVLALVVILAVFISFNPGGIFTKNSQNVPNPTESATTSDTTIATSSVPMSVAGRYVSKDGRGSVISDITFEQKGNMLTFTGEAIYPRYDENGEIYTANLGDLQGTTTLSMNKARLIITEYTYGEYRPCTIDFVFNDDKILDVSIEGDLPSCGWGNNVSFEGRYTRE